MPTIIYDEEIIPLEPPLTILEALEEAGFDIPFGCRAGVCHTCMMQADSTPPDDAQEGLSGNQKLHNYFLACSCMPTNDMTVSLISDEDKLQAKVIQKNLLNDTVLGLSLEVDCDWQPGQYLTVWYDETRGRSYSIASRCEENKTIELHIKRHDQGLVSRWLHDELEVGQTILLSEPMGSCFYGDDHKGKPILMAATGTGLAPLYGVLQEALAQGHDAPIYLYAASGDPAGLYYVEELKQLASQHTNFHYVPVVRRQAPAEDDWIVQEDVINLVKDRHTDLKGWKVFLCGSPEMIKEVQLHCFFQGVETADVLTDAFIIELPTEVQEAS